MRHSASNAPHLRVDLTVPDLQYRWRWVSGLNGDVLDESSEKFDSIGAALDDARKRGYERS